MEDAESVPKVARAGRRQGRRAAIPSDDGAAADAPPGAGAPSRGAFGAPEEEHDGAQEEEQPDSRNKGWGETADAGGDDDKKFIGISRRKAQQMEDEAKEDKTSGMRNRTKHEQLEGEAETILEIPELETEGEEDITFQVAEAPRAKNNRMQTMAELDSDQQYNLPNTTDLDIDLSLLTAVLCSSEQVEEPEDMWEPEILFTDVSSELTIEKETLESENAEESSAT